MLKDRLGFYGDDGEKIIFNDYTFCEIVKLIIVKYCNKNYKQANKMVKSSGLVLPIKDTFDTACIVHETPYYWAMNVVYGNCYWLKGIEVEISFEDEYDLWEQNIISLHNLCKNVME